MVPFSRVRQQAIRNLLSATLVLLAVTTVLGTRTIPVTIAIDVIVALTAHVCHEHIIYKPSQQQYKPGQTTKSEQARAATNSKLLIGKVKSSNNFKWLKPPLPWPFWPLPADLGLFSPPSGSYSSRNFSKTPAVAVNTFFEPSISY